MPSRYIALSQDEDEEKTQMPPCHCNHAPRPKYFVLCTLTIICHLLIVLSYFYLFSPKNSTYTSTEDCTTRLSSWSPALSAVEYQETYFDGKFSSQNEYKGPPSENIDQAWNRISLSVPALRLQQEDFAAMGKSLTERNWHRIPNEHGGGYLGMTEVFHLLHCLAEIRKLTFPEYYSDLWAKRDSPGTRVHTDHCLDIIRQRIMCTGDMGPVPFFDTPNHDLPMPDFSTRHQCRNFEKLLDWGYNNERAVHWDKMGDLNTSHTGSEDSLP